MNRIKEVLKDEETACAEKINPLLADKKGWEARKADLQASQKGKKEEEIPVSEKEDLDNTSKKIEEITNECNSVFSSYAQSNKKVSQLIDLALLSNGMLKGEALSRFIKRSVELI